MIKYVIISSGICVVSSCLVFMLIKTWIMMQFQRQFNGKYVSRSQDKIWLWPGWAAILMFGTAIASFIITDVLSRQC